MHDARRIVGVKHVAERLQSDLILQIEETNVPLIDGPDAHFAAAELGFAQLHRYFPIYEASTHRG
jgi:hypothetical protein